MTSRLSSLLVRDGLVRVHRMEHVFQRQVIYGGCLDTILLEMELVDDLRLQQYLSLATGLPPQVSAATSASEAEALRSVCNEDMAKKYKVVPAHHEGRSLRVLVCDPVDVGALESFADELDMSVQPMVVPEYQFRVLFSELFGGETDERFSKLAAKRSSESVGSSAKQVPTVTIGDTPLPEDVRGDTPEATEQSLSASDTTIDAIPRAIEPEATQPADSSERVRGTRAPAEQPKRRSTMELNTDTLREHVRATSEITAQTPPADLDDAPKTVVSVEELAAAPEDAQQAEAQQPEVQQDEVQQAEKPEAQQAEVQQAEVQQAEVQQAEVQQAEKPEAEQDKNEQSPYGAITAENARELLSATDDRDEIFIILLRAMRRRARFTSLFTIKGDVATGRVALSKPGLDNEEIRNIRIPLNVSSRFSQVVASKAFSVGALDTNDDASLREALEALGGGEVPKSALLLPVVMRDRLIAIAVAHNRDKGISVGRVTELLPLGTATADAVSRLIAKMRAAKKQSAPAAPAQAAARVDTKKTEIMMVPPVHFDAEDEQPAAVTESSATIPVAEAAMLELFDRIENGKAKVSKKAAAEALEKQEQVIAHLQFGFPGKLTRPRDEDAERLRAAEHGPILELVTQIGPNCGPALAEKMRDADREVRYYATLCAAELRPKDVVNELVERLFDGDESIRSLAVEALEGYPNKELHAALEFARKALHSEDNLRVKVAADGLTKLADCTAIPDLIDAHSRGGDAAEVSRRALFQLTSQDFGNSNRKWRSWWEGNQGRHRIEWMLDSLSQKNAESRKNASETLRKLTGEFFGYGHDLPKKEREKTRKLWEAWWDETGKARFL